MIQVAARTETDRSHSLWRKQMNHPGPVQQPAAVPRRLGSIDAYRGLVMFLMMGEALRFCRVSSALPESGFWKFLCHHQSHVEWIGCSLHYLIQPSFSFLVGVALPFSLSSRRARGESLGRMSSHAAWRALVLVLLGVFLRSIGRPQVYWTFEDTLSQIGLGYFFLFLLGFRPVRDQWIAVALLLLGYWAAFALYPLPAPDCDYSKVGVPNDWSHLMSGFAAHWNKNSNLAWAFDAWFLNLFPRESHFRFNGGGYATLSFIPTLATMILGLIAGGVLKSERDASAKLKWLAVAGVAGLGSGALLGWLHICPVVKRIWTPSWVLYSGGWCFILLGGFYALLDVVRKRRGMEGRTGEHSSVAQASPPASSGGVSPPVARQTAGGDACATLTPAPPQSQSPGRLQALDRIPPLPEGEGRGEGEQRGGTESGHDVARDPVQARHSSLVAFPLIVIGMNSIAAYCMAHLFEGFIGKSLDTVFGQNAFKIFGQPYASTVRGAGVLLVLWLLLFWLYRRKIFLRI